jgi:hypothetical protein
MKDIYISKSQFLKGLQCLKALYLHKYHPELMDEISESQETLFQSGQEVGLVARGLFPDGLEILFDEESLTEQIELTRSGIKEGIKTIYEAAFSHEGLFAKTDILKKGRKGWELHEIKNSTKIKDNHLEDVAFQYHVLKGNGLSINKAYLTHIDNQYERQGDIEVDKLFAKNDVTKEVKDLEKQIIEQIKIQKKMLKGKIPNIDIGGHCSDPYACEFQGHCWENIPEESVFNLKGRGINHFDLYQKGIIQLKDIPMEALPLAAQLQITCALKKKSVIKKAEIREFLDSLWYPMYFLDFETLSEAIPLFDGTKPYQKIPFQYSIHYLKKEGSKVGHHEFLAEPNSDPRKEIASRLVEQIPHNACVVVYNMSFEKGVLNNLKSWFPQYKSKLSNIVDNLHDLMTPFRKQHFYSWQMQGSYSIKAVLPALVPELSYEGMEVSDGDMAVLAYKKMCNSTDSKEIKNIRKALLEYCKLDSLGMVKILKKLKEC